MAFDPAMPIKRRLSWVLGALAYVAPPTWAYFEQASFYGNSQEQYGYLCGLPMLAIVILACLAAALLAAGAVALGWLSFRALPRPRPGLRVVELAILAVPLVLPAGYVALMLLE